MSFIPGIFKRFYWKYLKSEDHRVACLVECNGRILLIRFRFGKRMVWTVLTGGMKSGEKPKRAIVREVWNMMGIDVRDAAEVNTILVDHDDPEHTVHCFVMHAQTMTMEVDRDLVAEAKWFDLDHLPGRLTLVAKVLIQKLKYETLFQVCDEDPGNPACQINTK